MCKTAIVGFTETCHLEVVRISLTKKVIAMKFLMFGLIAATLVACGGQVGEEAGSCDAVRSVSHQVGDSTELGFTGQAVLDTVAGEQTLVLTWADNSTTNATLTTTFAGGEIEFQDREYRDDGSGREIAIDCRDTLVIPVTVKLVTDDGALNETWNVSLFADVANAGTLNQELASLTGTLDISKFAPQGNWEKMRSWIDLRLQKTGTTGSISGQVSGTEGETASAESFDVASLGPTARE